MTGMRSGITGRRYILSYNSTFESNRSESLRMTEMGHFKEGNETYIFNLQEELKGIRHI
jgi:hypothetical protein